MNSILKRTEEKLNKENTIIWNEYDTYYLTRFKSSNLVVLYINGEWYAGTDKRYLENAEKSITNMKVFDIGEHGWLKGFLAEHNVKQLNVHSDDMTIGGFNHVKKGISEVCELVAKTNPYIRGEYIEDKEYLAKAAEIADKVFADTVEQIKIGMTEKEVEAIILKGVIDSEATCPSFDPIVCFGKSGSNPHWTPSDKVLEENEMITIDMGVQYKGFCSDMTRTFTISDSLSEEEELIWNTVLESMNDTISKIKVGVATKDLHNNAMEVIAKAGYGEYFTHGTGHGVGIEIHERPVLGGRSNEILKAGNAVTVEPGIYIPGKYGVRLEQTIFVKEDGIEILNKSELGLYKK